MLRSIALTGATGATLAASAAAALSVYVPESPSPPSLRDAANKRYGPLANDCYVDAFARTIRQKTAKAKLQSSDGSFLARALFECPAFQPERLASRIVGGGEQTLPSILAVDSAFLNFKVLSTSDDETILESPGGLLYIGKDAEDRLFLGAVLGPKGSTSGSGMLDKLRSSPFEPVLVMAHRAYARALVVSLSSAFNRGNAGKPA